MAWDRHIADDALMDKWQLPEVESQYDFYNNHVQARLDSKKSKRVFVIISDALRYEVAQELGERINGEKRLQATLGSQLGVLPSYTQLGMAALLPHKELSYAAGQTVYADGQSTAGQEGRDAILQGVNGMAVKFDDLMGWSNQEGRDKVRDASVVYIYHDAIDARGDKLGTEKETFEACHQAIDELQNLVSRVINRLNANRVVITADHGFLFQQQDLQATDKTALKVKAGGAFVEKKRYVIG